MNDPKKNDINNSNNSGIVNSIKRSESHCVMRTHMRIRCVFVTLFCAGFER